MLGAPKREGPVGFFPPRYMASPPLIISSHITTVTDALQTIQQKQIREQKKTRRSKRSLFAIFHSIAL
jgi:hypothetical protein